LHRRDQIAGASLLHYVRKFMGNQGIANQSTWLVLT
jgi:hypothetical protein